MRADRLLRIMVLLQNTSKMTTRQLSRTLEVSERTILRDMDALSLAGIPIIAERGKNGGWKLMDHVRDTLSGMKLADLRALFILPSDQLLEQLGITHDGLDVRQKLAASVPYDVRHDAKQYLEKIYIDTGTWKSADNKPEALAVIQAALWEDRKIRITYRKASGDSYTRTIGPLGLVLKGAVWYVVAWSEEDSCRTYRVSRITGIEKLPETFVRPDGFHLSQYWHQSKAKFVDSLPRIDIEVLADRSILERLTFSDKYVQVIRIGHDEAGHGDENAAQTDKNGGDTGMRAARAEYDGREGGMSDVRNGRVMVPVTLSLHTEQEAIQYVLGFGSKMRLLRPERLIRSIVEQAASVIRTYERSAEP